MKIDKIKYGKYIEKNSGRSPLIVDCVFAFVVGGLICTIGQIFLNLFEYLKISTDVSRALVLIILMTLSALLTGFGIFDKIAKWAGAGTLVPITGFANSVVAPAIDNKSEGYILGLGANIFIIAGPVILYGITSGVIYGIIYYLWGLFF